MPWVMSTCIKAETIKEMTTVPNWWDGGIWALLLDLSLDGGEASFVAFLYGAVQVVAMQSKPSSR